MKPKLLKSAHAGSLGQCVVTDDWLGLHPALTSEWGLLRGPLLQRAPGLPCPLCHPRLINTRPELRDPVIRTFHSFSQYSFSACGAAGSSLQTSIPQKHVRYTAQTLLLLSWGAPSGRHPDSVEGGSTAPGWVQATDRQTSMGIRDPCSQQSFHLFFDLLLLIVILCHLEANIRHCILSVSTQLSLLVPLIGFGQAEC